jgi:hypothetical protein
MDFGVSVGKYKALVASEVKSLGHGTEGHLPLMPGNWTWKVETLYMDLGHLDATGVTAGLPETIQAGSLGVPLHGGQVTTQTHFTDWILRAGLNYNSTDLITGATSRCAEPMSAFWG